MFSMRMGLGMGLAGGSQKTGISYTRPEIINTMTGVGALWKTGATILPYANVLTTAEACVTAYNANGYGTAAKSDSLGLDHSETYNMYAFSFTPASYERTLIIDSAIHGNEQCACAAVLLLMQRIADATETNKFVKRLRENYRLLFIPVMNPWGYANNNRYNANKIYNEGVRGIDLNRNYDYYFGEGRFANYEGPSAHSEAETQNFLTWFNTIDSVDALIDVHTNPTETGTFAYHPACNYNNPHILQMVDYCDQLIDTHIVEDGYITRFPYCVSTGTVTNYMTDVLGIPAMAPEIKMGAFNPVEPAWDSNDDLVTRGYEQILACCKVYDKAFATEEDADWYEPTLGRAVDSATNGGPSTTYAAMLDFHSDEAEAYALADTTSVKKIMRGASPGEGIKNILVVGVARYYNDYLTITRAIHELDAYAAKTNIASLLDDCSITFIPSANPGGSNISDWEESNTTDDEVVKLWAHINGSSYDYVIAIAAPSATVGDTVIASDSFTPKILASDYITTDDPTAGDLTYAMSATGATIYPNNSVDTDQYVDYASVDDSATRFGDFRYGSLIRNHIAAILNLAASWNCEALSGTVATPVISPEAGEYSESQEITITCATPGTTIYYTTDGSTPDSGDTEYTAALTLTDAMTVKAIAYKTGWTTSAVASSAFTVADYDADMLAHIARVETDGGAVIDKTATQADITFLKGVEISAGVSAWNNLKMFLCDTGGVKVANNKVATLYDIRFNADATHDFTQGDTARQPAWTSNHAVFDAINDSMIGGSATLGISRNIGAATLFVVRKHGSDPIGARQLLTMSCGGVSTSGRLSMTTGNVSKAANIVVRRVDGATAEYVDSTLADTTNIGVAIGEVDFVNRFINIYLNGSAAQTKNPLTATTGNSSDTDSNAVSIGMNYLGGGNYGTGFSDATIYCVLVFTELLSQANREAIRDYLMTKYSIS